MLTDKFRRQLDYIRISVTDKCNLRCRYCMPADGIELLPRNEVLRNEEFIYFIKIFVSMGVKKIRFTGGEPFIRRGFFDILSKTREMFPDIELCLTTNGVLLDEVLDELYRLKLKKLNISLDTIKRERYELITGRDYFNRVISNIERALSYNYFDIKINSVLFQESIDELDDFLDFFKDRDVVLRFIERMPFFDEDKLQPLVSSDDLIKYLKQMGSITRDERSDTQVALMFNFCYRDNYRINIGVIPPVTHNFCSRCNRLRLTCDGFLKTCLHSNKEYDLKSPYRKHIGEAIIKEIIQNAVSEKSKQHNLDCASRTDEGCSSLFPDRSMSRVGG